MTRILADLPDEDIDKLDALGASQKRSRASLLREAIRLFLAQTTDDRSWIDRGYGLWADREDIPEGLEYQRAMREDRTSHEDI
ncbi:MAG: ribbon-helix-helix protein, CopG family [Sphingomonadales bacterium]|nr:ribbon-helix-helix protein, CopG family [Sphingomonadales bacterium]PIX65208.1 MAG: CopG family transcriptional regulator [Sphingomonadales bacterium CG_4_10_14_3_um_filter_58_15]NCO49206.1 ribbon-helix-helix protein, CopG family [Sphingomonadales bacterium]NCP00170.1 ribbon-helix-helix protein, CopG family [Sphingomonadales bacterium]NCP27940.1 ribbon-helix-helix protein, CopG family [Sphingomonadales bacterium]